jgi:hypothetical protein
MPRGIYQGNKGKKLSEESKVKIGNASRGRKYSKKIRERFSKSQIGNKHNLGKHHSEETRNKIRLAHLGKTSDKKSLSKMGLHNPNWKGGITPINKRIRCSREFKLWREAVFERDRYTCVWCGIKGGELHPDHIKPFAYFPELRFAIDNGRTLCANCHRTTDTWGFKRAEVII